MTDTLTLTFRSHECNGYPKARICVNGNLVCDHSFTQDVEDITIAIDSVQEFNTLTVERYGKENHHMVFENNQILKDQVLEIIGGRVRSARLPDYIFDKHSCFEFHGQVHPGSRYFGPNGTWTFKFGSPVVTWALDQKILQEAEYNQDFQYAWSTQLGPDSAVNILKELAQVREKLEKSDIK